jgi:hypothetical protein
MRLALVFALTALTPLAAIAQSSAPADKPAEKPADAKAEEPAEKPAEKPAEAAPADAEPATPAPTEGSLSVSSSPSGAKIFIDGKDTGKTTPAVDLAVSPGTHELKIVMGDKSKAVTFHLEAGGELSLNVNLPKAEPAKGDGATSAPADDKTGDGNAVTGTVDPDVAPPDEGEEEWTWMTVAGWSGLGLGTMGIVAGSVVLATQGDPDQGPLGFGLFGAGAGLILGGGVLLYLDEELAREEAPASVALRGLVVPVAR